MSYERTPGKTVTRGDTAFRRLGTGGPFFLHSSKEAVDNVQDQMELGSRQAAAFFSNGSSVLLCLPIEQDLVTGNPQIDTKPFQGRDRNAHNTPLQIGNILWGNINGFCQLFLVRAAASLAKRICSPI